MGKNKKSIIVYNGLELDSKEENEFIYWLDEAKEYGLIADYKYQPQEYSLSNKEVIFRKVLKGKKIIEKEYTLLNPHIYTPDFSIMFTKMFYDLYEKYEWNKIFKYTNLGEPLVIDIKGGFSRNGGDRTFSINQKWVYHLYKIYIQKIVPQDLFKKTWCPELAKLTPKKKQVVEKYKNLKSIKDIIKKG